jgi:hypothetical protein
MAEDCLSYGRRGRAGSEPAGCLDALDDTEMDV